jgi:ubiquinone/menaquinone biosynthesis C-methylase UbiE
MNLQDETQGAIADERDNAREKGTFEAAWRTRFEEFASKRDDDAGIAGWSAAGLDARVRRFTGLWRPGAPGKRWLDAGCGAGTYTRHLFEHGADVLGVDYSLPAIRKAQLRSPRQIRYAVADVRRLPFLAESFDGVLCFGVIQALNDSDAALRELGLLTRPGGELWVDALNRAFVVNAGRSLARALRRRPKHLRYESPARLRRAMVAQGFRDVTIYWMPIAPPRLPWLQRVVETAAVRAMMRVVPLFGPLISHAFIVRGTKARQ